MNLRENLKQLEKQEEATRRSIEQCMEQIEQAGRVRRLIEEQLGLETAPGKGPARAKQPARPKAMAAGAGA